MRIKSDGQRSIALTRTPLLTQLQDDCRAVRYPLNARLDQIVAAYCWFVEQALTVDYFSEHEWAVMADQLHRRWPDPVHGLALNAEPLISRLRQIGQHGLSAKVAALGIAGGIALMEALFQYFVSEGEELPRVVVRSAAA
jgi:hypothetical protein